MEDWSSETENINQNTKNIDMVDTLKLVKMINEEDCKVALAVQKALPEIAEAIDIIAENFKSAGRLIYFGAGTSGRLGILDASECPPTFSVSSQMVQGVIAGGDKAIKEAIEGAEDSVEMARIDFKYKNIKSNDTIVGISASGNAKYILQVLKLAQKKGCKTIAITSNINADIAEFADCFICIETGAEVISGSTRMKAGTAQKMVLNMLSTGAMIKIGKTYGNLMIDVSPTNEKLKKRAIKMVTMLTNMSPSLAETELENNGYKVKEAVLKLKYNITNKEASELIIKNNWMLRKVFKELDMIK